MEAEKQAKGEKANPKLKKSYPRLLILLAVFNLLFFSYSMASQVTVTALVGIEVIHICSDGLDNDSDGLIDFPLDPGCSSASDDDEYNYSQPQNPVGGGGGSIVSPNQTSVTITGRAYPNSKVGILKDSQLVLTTIAGPDSLFEASLVNLANGNYTFSVFGEDKNQNRSSLFTFSVFITSGATTKISGIFLAPTIVLDKSQVRRGDTLEIFGSASPNSDVNILINSSNEFFLKTKSDKQGIYLYNFDTSGLEFGWHIAKSKSLLYEQASPLSQTIDFSVGSQNVGYKTRKCPKKGDLNNDCKVDLKDFSIVAFWYKKNLDSSMLSLENVLLNGNSTIELADFSIMAYYWTG